MDRPHLSPEDHERVHSLSQRLFTFGDVDEVRRECLLFFERHLGAEKSNFFMAEAPEKPVSFLRIVNRGIEDGALHRYRRYYWRIDPFYKAFSEKRPAEISDVLTTEDIVSYKNLTRTEYYNDFLRPQSIHHQMTIHLKTGFQVLGVVALFRSRRAERFSAREKLQAVSAAPHISGALRTAILSEKQRALESVICSLVPDLPAQGILILDRFLDPVYKDESAEGILSALEGPGGDEASPGRSFHKEIYTHCRRLLETFGKESAKPRETSFELLSTGSRQRVSVRIRLLADPKSAPLFLLFLNPEESVLCMTRRLRGLGLTRREVEIVHLLAGGAKNQEIAEKLTISPYTVENHLRSIYRKMGVSNRTAVVHQLFQMSPGMSIP